MENTFERTTRLRAAQAGAEPWLWSFKRPAAESHNNVLRRSRASGAESIHMSRALVRRVQRLEAAKRTVYRPPCEVIYLDQHGRPDRAVPARPDGLPTRVIFLPAIVPLKEDEIEDMALPQPNRRR